MSTYDQKIKQLIEATPFWEKDGGGIRGRTIAPLLGGSTEATIMEEALPQQFNQQTNRSFTNNEEYVPDLVLSAMGGDFPTGCPYDLYPYVDAVENQDGSISASTKSGIAAVRHTACPDGVGNSIYDKWATLEANSQKVGFNAYQGEEVEGFVEVATKGNPETFVYGYADKGSSNFRMRAIGQSSEIELWVNDNSEYLLMQTGLNKTCTYGYADNQVYNYILAADKNEDSSYLRVYGNNSNVYATLATEQNKSVLYGYANDGAFNYITTATPEQSGSQYYNQGSSGYVEIATKGQAETFVYGYADTGSTNFRLRAFGEESLCEVFNNQIGGFAKISTSATESGFAASQNNDFSYLTQTTLRIEYANQDYFNANPGEMYVGYASGGYSYLFGGGLYVYDGSKFVDIKPPFGEDAYFQLTQWISLTGGIEQAYILRSQTLNLGIADFIQSILEALANLASALLDLAAQLAQLAFNIAVQLAELAAEFAAELAALAAQIAAALTALAAEFAAQLANAVANMATQLLELTTNIQAVIDSISNVLNDLFSNINALESALAQVESLANQLASEIAGLVSQIATLEAKNTTLEARIAAIEFRLDAASIECNNGTVVLTL